VVVYTSGIFFIGGVAESPVWVTIQGY